MRGVRKTAEKTSRGLLKYGSLLLVFALLFLVLQSATAAQTYSLTIEAVDSEGNHLEGGSIVLYTSDWEVVDIKQLDSNGEATWSDIEQGTYRFEVYADRDQQLFWGGSEISVSEEQTRVTFRRSEPYMTEIEIEEDIEDSSYTVDEKIIISPKVTNKQSFPRNVRANISIDTDGDSQFEQSVIRGPLEISSEESDWFGYEYTPSAEGEIEIQVIIESKIAGSWVITDISQRGPITIEPETANKANQPETANQADQPETANQANQPETANQINQPETPPSIVETPLSDDLRWLLTMGIILAFFLASIYIGSIMISRMQQENNE